MSAAGDRNEGRRASEVLREHGAVLGRVCMALLGDASAVERALERVARDVAVTVFEEGETTLPKLLGLARSACATQLSKLPLRATAAWGDAPRAPAREASLARAAIGNLKPTEREAVVLHLVGGLDVTQVAMACGVDAETARQRLARGVAQLVEQEKKR